MERLAGRYGLLRNESLARFTAARIGGAADWVYIARDTNDALLEVVTAAWARGIPVHILGGGANVLISDAGVRGLVVINRVSEIQRGEWHDGRRLSATAGVNLGVLSRRCQALGLSGLAWAVGVPGTVGGAVVGNAGAHGSDMAAVVGDVVVYEAERGPQLYTAADLGYSYRTSALKARADKRFVVLLATLRLEPGDPHAIQARIDEFTAYRKQTQPPGASLGSIFKNPPGDFAGRLIESAGLKGCRVGSAEVSAVHANWVINAGGQASAGDYHALIMHVRDVVQEKTGVTLETEIEFMGEW